MAVVSCPVTMLRGVPVITAPTEIDVASAESLRAALAGTAARGHATIVVDLSATRFCDSAGLHALIRAHRTAVAEGGELRLVTPARGVLRIFAITGVDRVMPRYADRAAAVAPLPAVAIDPVWQSYPRIVPAA
ncbi:MAG TPA: STAS domain-containing protein [Streptosporangiaceae bacterium]